MGKNNSINKHIKLPSMPSREPSLLAIIICFIIAAPLGMFMGFLRVRNEIRCKQHSDFNTYANIIGARYSVNIAEIAAKSGQSEATVIADLQAMIDKGYIKKGAYIDRKNNQLILDPSIIETEFVYTRPEPEVPRYKVEFSKPAEPKVEFKTKEEPVKSSVKNDPPAYNFIGNQEYEEKLRQIRDLDIAIDNEAVSERIDRIGHLTASIFQVVQEHPDRSDEVRKFMNYYLPTTFKLLKSYNLMEKQSYQGENIAASRKKIENILDSLVHAFEQQLDKLFHAEALDVDSDINVLETMMTSDGLIEPELSLNNFKRKSRMQQ